jgi:FkbM family methyltransferase
MKLVNNIAVIEGDDYISRWVEESGRLDHDQSMLPLILKHIIPGSTVLDVGAFIGDHTIAYARKVGQTGRVIAFEPSPEAFKCLKHNLKDFPQVDLRKECLSDESGTVSLSHVETNAGMTYAQKKKGRTKAITLDSLELERVDFIKIDAEGFEHNILKGAEETIRKFKPVMVIEIVNDYLLKNHTSNNDVYIWLMEMGYDYRNIYPGKHLYEAQLDLLCIPL